MNPADGSNNQSSDSYYVCLPDTFKRLSQPAYWLKKSIFDTTIQISHVQECSLHTLVIMGMSLNKIVI